MQALWLLLLPVAASCGWYAGHRASAMHKPAKPSNLQRDYFAGLNYVLNEQPDKAVDVFIKLLEVDSDTVETHLALGNLFRRKGEVDRAIRIHQNLIARSQLDPEHRLHALYALAQDYLKAGMLDRAERLFLELSTAKAYRVMSLQSLMRIYQQEREWLKAIEIAQQLRYSSKDSVDDVIAQYSCELAEKHYAEQQYSDAKRCLKEALAQDPLCVRANLIQARMLEDLGEFAEAIKAYRKVEAQDPEFLNEVIPSLMRCYQKLNNQDAMASYLRHCLDHYPKITASLIDVEFIEKEFGPGYFNEKIEALFVEHASLAALERLLKLYEAESDSAAKLRYEILRKIVRKLLTRKKIYRCTQCGLAGKMLHWQCPGCQQWAKVKPILSEVE